MLSGGPGAVQAAELAVRAGVEAGGGAALPGMILNTSKMTTYTDVASGQEHSVPAGRMECTMQVILRRTPMHLLFPDHTPSSTPILIHSDACTYCCLGTINSVQHCGSA